VEFLIKIRRSTWLISNQVEFLIKISAEADGLIKIRRSIRLQSGIQSGKALIKNGLALIKS